MEEKKTEAIKLPDEVAKKYKVTKGASRISAFGPYQRIDLNTMTVDFAERLSKIKFPYLEPVIESSKKQ